MNLPPPSADEVAARHPKTWADRISLPAALGLGIGLAAVGIAVSPALDAIKNWLGF
jgi:hypothetical protein